ncbi:SAM-dependent methyltransferase [Leptothoe kymatousa]|uniref:SAM-dependent methyltransferase n=1 Tax=Leptothoe kymatousa TAU-MAC 1615 TaxID=2364775 RepID=A0ABS5Y5P8_9CYAN|nr:SAM-dependent methyltransferase [Leptothoe kymatousa]MBT9312838.1 SAM-dependent methyltransferase [Leptothoe kymatousa TAU-MAC 1615]
MAMQLDHVVPFGRLFEEYRTMFTLTPADLQGSILSVADGPAGFNAQGTSLGYSIQSVDPLYGFTAPEIKQRFDAVVDNIMAQIANSPDDWVWGFHKSPRELRHNRERAMEWFCRDFDQGKAAGRYAVGELPRLAYPDNSYDLGLCSHFLFLYSQQFDRTFHINSIRDMLRVCQEVRIFPLLTLGSQPSPHLKFVIENLTNLGYRCEVQTVAYELQRNGNKMLSITSP